MMPLLSGGRRWSRQIPAETCFKRTLRGLPSSSPLTAIAGIYINLCARNGQMMVFQL
jgi:hypothetical protein